MLPAMPMFYDRTGDPVLVAAALKQQQRHQQQQHRAYLHQQQQQYQQQLPEPESSDPLLAALRLLENQLPAPSKSEGSSRPVLVKRCRTTGPSRVATSSSTAPGTRPVEPPFRLTPAAVAVQVGRGGLMMAYQP